MNELGPFQKHNPKPNPSSPVDQPKLELFRDENGKFCVTSEDASGKRYRKEFRLLSNTAETTVEIRAISANTLDENELQKHDEDPNPEQRKKDKEMEEMSPTDFMGNSEQKIILKVEKIKW